MSGLKGDLVPFLECAPDGQLEPSEIPQQYMKQCTGAHFESCGADRTEPNQTTIDDLVAVTLLSIPLSRRASGGITPTMALTINAHDDDISALLTAVPADRDLHTLTSEEFDRWLGEKAPATTLYDWLRNEVGMGPTATHKLMARKRPRLAPVRDRLLTTALHNATAWCGPGGRS